jgi:hypothetical protein
MNPLEKAWAVLKEENTQDDKLNPETYEEYQALTPEEKSEAFAQWFNQNITGKKINCEDNSHEEGWSYCGKPECESCGGGEPAENEDPTVGSQPNFVANEREHMRRRE